MFSRTVQHFVEQQWCAQRIRQHASWQQDFLFCSRLFPTSRQRRDFPTISWRATMAAAAVNIETPQLATVSFSDAEVSCLNMFNWKEKISNKDLDAFIFLWQQRNSTTGARTSWGWMVNCGCQCGHTSLAYDLSGQHICTNSVTAYYALAIPVNATSWRPWVKEEHTSSPEPTSICSCK